MDGDPPLYAGLSWNNAACRMIALGLFTGVAGGIAIDLAGGFGVAPLEGNNEAGIGEIWLPSSGSTNSKSCSAALSACAARALRASSTTEWGTPLTLVVDGVGLGDAAERLSALGVSHCTEKLMRSTESPSPISLSAGKGIVVAISISSLLS